MISRLLTQLALGRILGALAVVCAAGGYLQQRFSRRQPVLADEDYVAVRIQGHDRGHFGVFHYFP